MDGGKGYTKDDSKPKIIIKGIQEYAVETGTMNNGTYDTRIISFIQGFAGDCLRDVYLKPV